MKVLLLGSGGREHALAWKIAQSPKVEKLYIAPGNAGTSEAGENVNLKATDFPALKAFALEKEIDMIVVGPEDPLVQGIFDSFKEDPATCHIDIIGPTAKGATLEGSKEFAKGFMMRHNIPTARYKSITSANLEVRTFVEDEQIDFLQTKNVPFVTIGSTSANYKGVIQIDHNHKSACKELTSIILMKQMDKIALIGGNEEHVVTQSRLRGFREAYAKMGKTLDEDLMFLSQDNQVLVEKAVKEALNRQADCILCMDDAVCSRVLKTLRQQHVKVPEDVRVASFYNSMVLENNVPSITSLSFDAKELGMVACRTLLDLTEGLEVKERTLLPYEVVLKESTK